MNKIYLGKIVNTHGIKGEIRILSNFEKKELVFIPGFTIYINDLPFIIENYRQHKNYDMVTLNGINNINDVLKYVGSKVYINKDDLKLKKGDFILNDLINMKIMFNNQEYGIVEDIYDFNGNIVLKIKYLQDYYIPYKSNYIKEIDLFKKIIYTNDIKELIL